MQTQKVYSWEANSEKIFKICDFLLSHAEEIEKEATVHHLKYLGEEGVRKEILENYAPHHASLLKEVVKYFYPEINQENIATLKKFAEQFAERCFREGLTLEEAVDGIIFLKQAIWKKVNEEGLLSELSVEDFYYLSQSVGTPIDTVSSEIAFLYHRHYVARLEEHQRQQEAILQFMPVGLLLIQPKTGKILFMNKLAQTYYGNYPDDADKEDQQEYFATDLRGNRIPVQEMMRYRVARGERVPSGVEADWHTPQGVFSFIVSADVVSPDDGAPEVGVVVIQDVTKLRELERQKGYFLAIASHELRTPLSSIKLLVDLLHMKLGDAHPDLTKHLVKIDEQINEVVVLVDDLLDVTKIETGKLTLSEGEFNFDDLLQEAIEEIAPLLKKHTVLKEGESGKVIDADRKRIKQVLINLLTNAAKYSPDADRMIVRISSNDD
jgi:signal transduction histidine kinase